MFPTAAQKLYLTNTQLEQKQKRKKGDHLHAAKAFLLGLHYERYNTSPDCPTLLFMMLRFPTGTDIFIWFVSLFVLKYHVSMFKPLLHIHGTMLLHESLTWLEKHPTLSQEKTHYLTVISSTTLNSSYSMKGNIQMWFTRTAYPTDPHYYCCICNCPRIQERQVFQREVTSFIRPVNTER